MNPTAIGFGSLAHGGRRMEDPQLWTAAFKEEIGNLFLKAVELEYRYAEDTMLRGVLGLNAAMFKG